LPVGHVRTTFSHDVLLLSMLLLTQFLIVWWRAGVLRTGNACSARTRYQTRHGTSTGEVGGGSHNEIGLSADSEAQHGWFGRGYLSCSVMFINCHTNGLGRW